MSDIAKHEIFVDNTRVTEVDFSVTAGRSQTTVDSVQWSVISGNVSVASESLNSAKATALITAPGTASNALVRVLATMTNGEKVSEYIEFKVVDPSNEKGSY